jgi:CRISPR-associated protein (Cas_Csd1)/CRISPR-associated protein (Cas_Cas5)
VEYQVRAHFEWNEHRPELKKDRIEGKHFEIAKRSLERGGRQDIFLGTRDCQGYVEPCDFGSGKGAYDDAGELQYGLMFHSFDYPDETGENKLASNFWEQVVVAWAVTGQSVPPLIAGSNELTACSEAHVDEASEPYEGDAGQAFSSRLNRLISGYAAQFTERDDIVVMALDSATRGGMAMTYYRELSGSEFLERIRDWHDRTAWPQNMGKDRRFTGAPAPRDIAEAAYGRRADEKLRKSTVERLLPSIVDRRSIPRDLVEACAQRAANRAGQEHWEWERTLGIACALVRGSRREEHYSMSLEEHRTKRDYLFGRLLAVAEKIEGYATLPAR